MEISKVKRMRKDSMTVDSMVMDFLYRNRGKAFRANEIAVNLPTAYNNVKVSLWGLIRRKGLEYRGMVLKFKTIKWGNATYKYYWLEEDK